MGDVLELAERLEVTNLAGGIDTLLARARALAAEGRLELASHLVD